MGGRVSEREDQRINHGFRLLVETFLPVVVATVEEMLWSEETISQSQSQSPAG